MSEVTKEQVVEYLSNLPVIQIAELVKELEGKWGVTAAPQVVSGGGPVQEEVVKEEQTEFDLHLDEIGPSKMAVIKVARPITQLGLKEIKEKVESAPCVLLAGLSKEDAESHKKALEDAGAKVSLK